MFLAAALWAATVASLAWSYRRTLRALWTEPVVRAPVLILESDDWGPGPATDAAALERLAALLAGFRDALGRQPVMTLGVLLAVPDREAIASTAPPAYRRVTLADPAFTPVRAAMAAGEVAGVFAAQLHGLEHLWPPALMAATGDPAVAAWLAAPGPTDTGTLPPHLQTRWADASVLPSRPLSEEAIRQAATEEVAAFRAVFGRLPEVAVPPTFVWTEVVERAWAEAGVRVVVTPGQRHEGRDAAGRPTPGARPIRNAERGGGGVLYLTRDVYFEPALGHTPERALADVAARHRLGRPALIETHRFNYTGEAASRGLTALEALLRLALARFPGLRFRSTAELAEALARRDPDLVETRLGARLAVWLLRVAAVSRLKKLAWATGAVVPGWVLFLSTRRYVPA